jgi:nucleoside-diphosphate-sugar epimerase
MIRLHPVPGFHQPPLSYIHVEDLAEILIRAAERGGRVPSTVAGDSEQDQPGEGVYYAVAPEYPTLADWGRMARPLLRRPFAPVIPMPNPLPWFFASCSEVLAQLRGRAEMFNRDKIREAQVESWACSPAAIERDLDFTPPKPLQKRLEETIEWYKQAGWLRR